MFYSTLNYIANDRVQGSCGAWASFVVPGE